MVDDCARSIKRRRQPLAVRQLALLRDVDRLGIERGKPRIVVNRNSSELTILTWGLAHRESHQEAARVPFNNNTRCGHSCKK